MHPGPSASIAGNKLSVRTTAEELNRRKATVYIHPIFAPCRLMGSMRETRAAFLTNSAGFSATQRERPTSINAVLSVMPPKRICSTRDAAATSSSARRSSAAGAVLSLSTPAEVKPSPGEMPP